MNDVRVNYVTGGVRPVWLASRQVARLGKPVERIREVTKAAPEFLEVLGYLVYGDPVSRRLLWQGRSTAALTNVGAQQYTESETVRMRLTFRWGCVARVYMVYGLHPIATSYT